MVEAIYGMNNQIVENTFFYQIPGSADAQDLLDLAAAWVAEWVINIKPYIALEVSLNSVKVTDLTTNTSPTVTYTTGLPQFGAQTGALLPNNVSLAVTRRTALRGRSQRGRIYWPGFTEPNVVNNAVATNLVQAIVIGLNATNVIVTTLGNWEAVVVSRYTNGAPRASGIFTPITNWSTDAMIDSQRRRLPGRGA
jgi:hypothetical protein